MVKFLTMDDVKIIRSNRQSIAMKILPNSTLVVHAPTLLPKFMIDKFIKDHWDWVEKSRAKKLKIEKKIYKEGENFLFLGEKITIKIGNHSSLLHRSNTLLVPEFMKFRIEKEIKTWFMKQAEKIILEQLES